MRIALKLSLAANAVLVAVVFWLAQTSRPAAPAVLSASAEPRAAFYWSQLESTDYRAYIANLRAVGCPRQTIRDIIVADVDGVYAERRKEVARTNSDTGHAGSPALRTQLQRLQAEEAGFITALLGPPPGSAGKVAANVAAAPAPARTRRSRLPEAQEVALPLAFQDPGAELKLDPTQQAVINDLRESFNNELKGLNLDPASPEYHRHWLMAQREADEMMSAMLGSQFTLNYQMQAQNQQPAK